MEEWILQHGVWLRAVPFVGLLAGLTLVEQARPWRARHGRRGPRWRTNLALLVAGALAVRIVVPAGAVGAALWAEDEGLGLLPALGLPGWLRWAAGVAALDLALWLQHLALHRVPLLWRLHRIHHTDVDLDATSAGRFHPLEIVGSLAWKAAVAVAVGVPAAAVLVYEAVLAAFAVLTHANLGSERGAWITWFLVTPAVHRIHHSIHPDESSANFGTVTTTWDRAFGTLRLEPREDSRTMTLGVAPATDPDAP